jgi:trimeric autotransporter adhesin
MKTQNSRNSIGRPPLRLRLPRVQSLWIIRGFPLISLALACFALSPTAQAVVPAPDGGYANQNTAEGTNALFSLTSGSDNTALGYQALFGNTTGHDNTATGTSALRRNTVGANNTATGSGALYYNSTGSDNTATGDYALGNNSSGHDNTANGYLALNNNASGQFNTAMGVFALGNYSIGSYNTAIGEHALGRNYSGHDNTATGAHALWGGNDSTGSWNTASGVKALYSNSSGYYNTASGYYALLTNTSGFSNTATGTSALRNNTVGANNTANGVNSLFYSTGSDNIGLGYNAGLSLTYGSGNVCIGSGVLGIAGESNTTRIKNVYSSVASARAVYVNSDNKIGTLASSRRFKDEIKPMDRTSEAILALKPVTFRYKKQFDGSRTPMFGLIAEEVEKTSPDLVSYNEKGEVETVRYEAVNAMLLNEFLKEHRTVQQQQKEIEALKAELKEQKVLIQKVNDKVELNRPAPQTVADDR